MYPDFSPCAHPGCSRHALHGSRTCGPHASAVPLPSYPTLAGQPAGPIALPGPFDLVIAQRDSLHRFLRLRAGYPLPDLSAELRTLRALALTAADLAAGQGGPSGADEIDAFLASLSREILANPSLEADP
jgi:hypothetical protein